MFSLRQSSLAELNSRLSQAGRLDFSYAHPLGTEAGVEGTNVPKGYLLDHTRTEIGTTRACFHAAKDAFRAWSMFDLGWIRVANPRAQITVGTIVAVEAHTLGLWSVNFSRILYVIQEEDRFGFGYGTTPMHVERGEERFLLEFDPSSGTVWYDLLAVSQPANHLATLAYPYTRHCQRRFAIESHHRMKSFLHYPGSG